jgi:predicted MPP superfamily phosphohydrolase
MNDVISPPHLRWPSRGFFKRLFWSAAGSCALGGLYAWALEHHYLRVERHDMRLEGLGKGLDGAKLVHISDLHCSPLVLDRYLRECVSAVNALEPDFVAITGDFITGPRYYARRVAHVLARLSPRIATVACLGNHDYGIFHPRGYGSMRGLSEYLTQALAQADIFVMLNEPRVFSRDGADIQFVGLEDYWSPRYNPHLAFAHARPGLPTVALCHNPDAAAQVARFGAQWVLAGHTHGTNNNETRLHELVMPVTERHYHAGGYELAEGRRLYVNRGLGYARRWNLNTRPEITLFTLKGRPTDPHVPRGQ